MSRFVKNIPTGINRQGDSLIIYFFSFVKSRNATKLTAISHVNWPSWVEERTMCDDGHRKERTREIMMVYGHLMPYNSLKR